jgi:hypothetical protein
VSHDFRERLLEKLTSKGARPETPLAIHLANIRAHWLDRDVERERERTAEEQKKNDQLSDL